ncbi:hypothetical protein KPL74_11670 [Bacillus sp. NP157]|nr:hypothetical protein KPL74_11670 [Bacillus sp. NP157]
MTMPRILAALWSRPAFWMALAIAATVAIYAQGTHGAYLFDDFPNIVDNDGIHISDWSVPSLVTAALSSPSSELKRPLASLTFALNFLISGLDPTAMKITNIVIHVLNGAVLFALLRLLFAGASRPVTSRDGANAALVASIWLVLPINVTAVLYIVQRMESLANLFVLLALLGYVIGRRRMSSGRPGFALATASLIAGTAIGALAKETAILAPLYAMFIEWFVFRWRASPAEGDRICRRTAWLFVVILVIPFIVGAARFGPAMFADATWAPRSFTMPQRLWSEARIVTHYITWSLLPLPTDLSFYHDDFVLSTGWLTPWTTLACIGFLALLAVVAVLARKRYPLASLGIAWYLGCHALTATIIPLELIYEHRNYFASIALVLIVVAMLRRSANPAREDEEPVLGSALLLGVIGVYAAFLTTLTAVRWDSPLSLARELAVRAPASPRAQYELGRAYVIATHYRPDSPLVKPTYDVLEQAAALPGSSTLPEQALIFFAAKLHQPIKDAWWDSMEAKLRRGPITIEDESAIMSLSSCDIEQSCDLDNQRMLRLFLAALAHPRPRARLIASYGDFAWRSLEDKQLGYEMTRHAAEVEPAEPAYHISTLRLAAAMGDAPEVKKQWDALQRLNVGNRLGSDLAALAPAVREAAASTARSR